MIGVIEQIKNTEVKEVLENTKYIRVTVYCEERKKYVNLLLTLNDFDRVIRRGEKNIEDCYHPNWWERFIHWIIRR